MESNTKTRLGLTVAVLFSAALMGGCWDDDDNVEEPAPPITQVPTSAGASTAAYISFLKALVSDETSEPLDVSGFTAPADDTGDVVPVI